MRILKDFNLFFFFFYVNEWIIELFLSFFFFSFKHSKMTFQQIFDKI